MIDFLLTPGACAFFCLAYHGVNTRAVVAVDVLHRRVGTKKYTKTIYLITSAEDPIENPADLEATVQHMVQQVKIT